MPGRFDGKLVLITGASQGIGHASARAFAAQGATVVVVARSWQKLAELAASDRRIVPVAADVADGASMEAMAARVLAERGVPHVVIANAGIGLDARFQDTSDAAMRELLEVNTLGVLRTVRPFLPGMIARGSGRILLVSSVVGKRGIPHYTAYSASKFALHGMADCLRPELHGSGVTVGIVCPSSTTTEFQANLRTAGPAQNKKRLKRHSAESVAEALVSMAGSTRRERILSLEGKAMALLDTLAPWLMDFVLGRVFMRHGEER
ncbi:MAG TPA: SDR family NAD(P)-dependent oxidoreductase [Candidatus Polarisedimenticolaceae bacterium]|nr:SDR family NAD(P)-dependent oxidoreductase [Candidatus Polarisedimenticolaceae bacterium]